MNRSLALAICCVIVFQLVSFSPLQTVADIDDKKIETETFQTVLYCTVVDIQASENTLIATEGISIIGNSTDTSTVLSIKDEDRSEDDEEETRTEIKLKLIDNLNASDFEKGWAVEAICRFEKNSEKEEAEYFDCDVVALEDIERNVTREGLVYKIDHNLRFCVIEENSNYYRIEFDKNLALDDLLPGKLVEISGKSKINRPYFIYDAVFETKEDTQTTRTLDNCIVPPQGWHDRLFRVKSNNEFWQVNFKDGQPNGHLKDHMVFGIKGVKDNHLEQTLHDCVLLDYLTNQSIAGTITEILPGHGTLSIKDTKDRIIKVNSEMSHTELFEYAVGDHVKIIGYKQDMRYDLPVLFSMMDFVDGSRLQPVNFIGEVLNYSDCKRNRHILVRTGLNIWTVFVPDSFDCYSIRPDDWVKVEGQVESYLNYTIKATSVQKSKAELFAEIIDSKYSKDEIKVRELQSRSNWLIQPKRGRRASYINGTKVRIMATTHEYRDYYLEDAIVTKLAEDVGMIVFVDSINQLLTVKREDGSQFTVEIRTDWNNINEFFVGTKIEVVGVRTKDGYKSAQIDRLN